jgi:hypothetical protein
MVEFPEKLYDCTYLDEESGERLLKKDASEEQRRIFEQFLKEFEDGTLTDRAIEFQP